MAHPYLALRPTRNRLVSHYVVAGSKNPLPLGMGSVNPMDQQAILLPKCDIVILSGSTTINGTIDELLEMCSNAREIIMVGPSTPMYAEGWKGTGLTGLAGALWNNEEKEEIFLRITHGCGVQQIKEYMCRKLLFVK